MLRSSIDLSRVRVSNFHRTPFSRPSRVTGAIPRAQFLTRPASTVSPLDNLPAVGDKLYGFTVQEKKNVPELHLTAVRLAHDKTGADYLHVARDDKNNVFGIGFKTNPPDSTGVPHILEHTTLCGSEKCLSSHSDPARAVH